MIFFLPVKHYFMINLDHFATFFIELLVISRMTYETWMLTYQCISVLCCKRPHAHRHLTILDISIKKVWKIHYLVNHQILRNFKTDLLFGTFMFFFYMIRQYFRIVQIPREICMCYDSGPIEHTLHDLDIKINFILFKCVNCNSKPPIYTKFWIYV